MDNRTSWVSADETRRVYRFYERTWDKDAGDGLKCTEFRGVVAMRRVYEVNKGSTFDEMELTCNSGITHYIDVREFGQWEWEDQYDEAI